MANSLVSDYIKTVIGDLILEATNGNVELIIGAGSSVILPSDPIIPLGAATKQYVDGVADALISKDSVRVTTVNPVAATRTGSVLTATSNGAITIDGVLLSVTNRVLVKDGLTVPETEIKEETDLTCSPFASYPSSPTAYLDISTHLNTNRYRVWFDTTGGDVAPPADGRTLVQVDISADGPAGPADDIATTLFVIVNPLANLSASTSFDVLTVTNDTAGDAEDADGATAVSAAGMTVTTTTQGVSDLSANGIYTVTITGDAGTPYELTRAIDADEDAEVRAGLFTFTAEGTVNADVGFLLSTNDPITVNFTAQTFIQIGDVSGPGAGNSTDNALARWDTTSGKLIQNSLAILNDAGALSGLTQLDVDNIRIDGNTIISTNTNGDIFITPDGTGNVIIPGNTLDVGNTRIESNVISTTNTDGSLSLTPNGSGSIILSGSRSIFIGGESTGTLVAITSDDDDITLLAAGTGKIQLFSNEIFMDGSGVFELNSDGGKISIGNDADAFDIDIGTGAAARTITIGNGTGATSLVIEAGTGNIDIGINATDHDVTIGSITGGAGTIIQGANTGVQINGAGGVIIESSAGTIFIGGNADAFPISIGTAASARDITIGNGTGDTELRLMAGTGNIEIGVNDVARSILIGVGGTTVQTITIGSTADASITQIQSGTAGSSVTSTGLIAIQGAGGINLESSAGQDINIGGNVAIYDVNIGTGAAAQTVTIGDGTSTSSVVIEAGTGPVNIGINATDHSTTIGSVTGVSMTTIRSGTGGTKILGAIFEGGAIAGTTTLSADESNTTFSLTQTAGAYVITLPIAAAGLVYEFVLIVAAAGTVTITATGAHFFGSYNLNDAATQIVADADILFVGSTSVVGDRIELKGIDSTHWKVSGMSTIAGGIIVSGP